MNYKDITVDQCKDTGLAIILILMIIAWITKNITVILPGILILIITMTIPKILRPLSYLWFGLSYFMGGVVSKIFLTMIFIIIVTPVGLLRRILGKDPMGLKEWKNGQKSVLKEKNHTFVAEDIQRPF